MKNDPLSSPSPVALPHFWWKGSSPRAVIPLEVNAFLGKPAACCHFAIGAARKIERRGTPKTLCFIGGFELHQKCGRADAKGEVQGATTTRRAYQCGAQGRTNPYER